MTKNPRLHPARCPSCRQEITRTLEGAQVFCPRCQVWTIARTEPWPRPDPAANRRPRAPTRQTRAAGEPEQLTLF